MPICHTCRLPVLIFEANSNVDPTLDIYTGNCWCACDRRYNAFCLFQLLTFSAAYEPLRMYLATYVTQSSQEAPRQTRTSGRRIRPSPVPVSNWANAQSNGTQLPIGNAFGTPRNVANTRRSPPTSGSDRTQISDELPWTTSRRNLLNELLTSSGDQLARVRADALGRRQAGQLTQRFHAPNSGMAIRDNNTSLSTNSPGRSQSNTYYDGLTATPLTSRQRVQEWYFVPHESGSRRTSTRDFGIHRRQRNNVGR